MNAISSNSRRRGGHRARAKCLNLVFYILLFLIPYKDETLFQSFNLAIILDCRSVDFVYIFRMQ